MDAPKPVAEQDQQQSEPLYPSRSRAHRVNVVVLLATLAAAAISYLLDWHEFSPRGLETLGDALGCWQPDCHPPEHGPTKLVTHTGLQHMGPMPLVLLVLWACFALAAIRWAHRPSGLGHIITALANSILLACAAGMSMLFGHFLNFERYFISEFVFGAATVLGVLLTIALVVEHVKYRRAMLRLPPQ